MEQLFPGIYRDSGKLLTPNLVPGFRSHSEEIVRKGREFRVWDPNRSKPAAAIAKGLKHWPLAEGSNVLYLGIANGNTSTFFSDIIGHDGVIYGVEVSARSMRDLNPVASRRGNIVPILANAKLPGSYGWVEKVDVVFQDVAAPDQGEILIRNCERFLKPGGAAMLALKARSIDVTMQPREIYRQEARKLEKRFSILEKRELDPFEKDHLFLVMRWKSRP